MVSFLHQLSEKKKRRNHHPDALQYLVFQLEFNPGILECTTFVIVEYNRRLRFL